MQTVVTGSRRRLRAVAAMSALGAALWIWAPGSKVIAFTTCSNFSAVGSAQGVQGEVDNTGFLVDEEDADAPAAQAALDSEGGSVAYAAEPYPGDSVLTALGLENVPASDYPLLAQSSYPTAPHASVSAPGISLIAGSQSLSSSADATSGGQSGTAASVGNLSATAAVQCQTDGSVSATALSDDQSLSFGAGVLRLGLVRSEATAVTAADGKSVLTSQLEASQVTVAGQAAELTPAGLVAEGSAVSLPSSSQLAQVLAAAGIRVAYLAASRDSDGHGVVAPGLVITVSHSGYATQPTAVNYVLGQAHASARVGVAGDFGSATGAGLPLTISTPSGSTGSNVSAVGTGAATSSAGPNGRGSRSSGLVGQVPPPTVGSAGPASVPSVNPSGSSGDGQTAALQLVPAVSVFSSFSLYLVIVVGACVLLVVAVLVKMIGVKLKWT